MRNRTKGAETKNMTKLQSRVKERLKEAPLGEDGKDEK